MEENNKELVVKIAKKAGAIAGKVVVIGVITLVSGLGLMKSKKLSTEIVEGGLQIKNIVKTMFEDDEDEE
jgi:hypothetical protein